MKVNVFSLIRIRRSTIHQRIAAVLAFLLLPCFSWLESTAGIPLGAVARGLQGSAQTIHYCGESRGSRIIQQVCVNGSPAPVDDLNQLELDAVNAYLAAHLLPASDAHLIYDAGRTDLRNAIRGSMLAILLGIVIKDRSARTQHEQALYNWLQFAVQQNEIAEYAAALAEYQRFQKDPCHFKLDPTIASQYGLSYDGSRFCDTTLVSLGVQVPDAAYFTAFGLEKSYGRPAQTRPNFAALVTGTQINEGEALGIAAGAGAVLATAAGIATATFFDAIAPFAYSAGDWALLAANATSVTPAQAAVLDAAAAAGATEEAIAPTGPVAIVILSVLIGVEAGVQVFNNQDQLNQLNNLQNLITQAQSTAPDLNAFANDSTGLGTFKLNETLVAQTLPDVPSTAALPAHGVNDPLFLVTASSDRTSTTANSFVYSDWTGIAWQATTAGGWFAQICAGDDSGQRKNCPQPDSFTASIHYVDWTGTNRIASRLGSNFTIVKAAPSATDKPCPADSSTGVSPGTDFSNCSSYVSTEIRYAYQGNQYKVSLSQEPAFATSSTTIYFTYGTQRQTAKVTAYGAPTPQIVPASLFPPGVSFGESDIGTASLNYIGGGTSGTYPVRLLAHNAQGSVTQYYKVVIQSQLQITSPTTLTGYTGLPVNFLVTTTGSPTPHLSIDPHILPDGLSFHDNGNGTATISGTPSQLSGPCIINSPTDCAIVATSGFQIATQRWLAEFQYPPDPTLLSTSATFVAGRPGSFFVTTTGGLASIPKGFDFAPQADSWLSFHDNGDGTGVLRGTPPAGSSGRQQIVLIPHSIDGQPILEIPNFTISVINPPQFVNPNLLTLTVGQPAEYPIATNGQIGIVTEVGGLPQGVELISTNGIPEAYVLGQAAVGSGGLYTLHLTYTSDLLPPQTATQDLNLAINEGPAFTSAPTANFYGEKHNTFAVTVSGYPALSSAPVAQSKTATNYVAGMEFTVTGLPPDLTFSNLNPEGFNTGTLVLSGKPSSSDVGQHQITISASNGIGTPVIQTFTLNIGGTPGDVNDDGVTNCADFDLVKASLHKSRGQAAYNPAADVDNDGVVNNRDLSIVAKHVPNGTTCQ